MDKETKYEEPDISDNWKCECGFLNPGFTKKCFNCDKLKSGK